MGQVALAQVVEALAGHGRVGHPVLLGDEGRDGLQQRALARRRRRPHDDGQGCLQLAGHRGQVAQQAVGGLAHHPGPEEVGGDALHQGRVTQQLQGGLLLGSAQGHRGVGWGLGGPHHLLGQGLTRQQHPAELAVHDLLGHADLGRRGFGEHGPGPRRVDVPGGRGRPGRAPGHHRRAEPRGSDAAVGLPRRPGHQEPAEGPCRGGQLTAPPPRTGSRRSSYLLARVRDRLASGGVVDHRRIPVTVRTVDIANNTRPDRMRLNAKSTAPTNPHVSATQ